MKSSKVLRLASVVVGIGLLTFWVQYSLGSAKYYAKDNAVYTKQFTAAAYSVSEYRRQNGKNPPREFLQSTNLDGFEFYHFRPLESSFDFPEWSKPGSYAIGRWNGDYMEWYDSASGESTTGRKDTQAEVIRGMWPEFLFAFILIFVPFLFPIGKQTK